MEDTFDTPEVTAKLEDVCICDPAAPPGSCPHSKCEPCWAARLPRIAHHNWWLHPEEDSTCVHLIADMLVF